MELGLSLGDTTSKLPYPFLHKMTQKKNMVNKDLGFCMGLGLTNHNGLLSSTERRASSDPPVQLDLLPVDSPVVVPLHQQQPSSQLRLPWLTTNNLRTEPGSSDRSGKTFDVNRFPVAPEEEEEEEEAEEGAAVSSPNSTVSSFQMDFSIYRSSGGAGGGRSNNNNNNYKRGHNHIETISGTNNYYNEGENDHVERRGGCSRGSDDEDNDGSTRKKLRLTKDQSAFLEESFKEHNTLNPKQKLALAKQLNLRPRQVEVWFQNRRARTKLKQTEVDCEYLKRCCETLTEENRRLQKELQELRALKTSQPFFMQLPATTLTMCPSCERVATTTTTTSAVTGTTTTTTTTAVAAKTAAATTATNAALFPAKSVLYPFITHAKNSHAHQAKTHQAAS